MTAPGCLDPGGCPVPSVHGLDLRRLRLAQLPAGTTFHTAYRQSVWPALFNPSAGNARFSPLYDGSATVVPSMYGALTQTVALLETAFHGVHQAGTKMISQSIDLASRGLVALTTPVPLKLVDLRDEPLARLGLARAAMVSTTPQHYACTREWAAAIYRRRIGGVSPDGLLWRSRIAELAQADSLLLRDLLSVASDVFVVFGDRVPMAPDRWRPGDPHYRDLTTGTGRELIELIAEQLGAVVVPN